MPCLPADLHCVQVQETLRYSPSDLNTPRAIQHFYSRLRVAARDVCPNPWTRDFGTSINPQVREARQCAAYALEQAVLTVNDVRLSAYHYAHIGSVPHMAGT